jgi:hypothetical protein
VDLRRCHVLNRMPRLQALLHSISESGAALSSFQAQRLDFATQPTQHTRYPLLKVQFEPGSPQTPAASLCYKW